jgi:hypothetical protein
MASAPALADAFASSIAIARLKPTPAITGHAPWTSSTVARTISWCSAGVSE